ncbi:MAG: Vitamin B12-binding protein [Dehalococcoidia bacterium]|nr:Vitamin B12-binding protein [Chloroflexota bacterium]
MRIISLAPSITETLIFLGLGEDIVGVTEQCNDRLAVGDKMIIGSFVKPDVSKIVSAKPDLVITAGRIHGRLLEEFGRHDVRVSVFGSRSVSGILDTMEELGSICGRAVGPQVNPLRERVNVEDMYSWDGWQGISAIRERSVYAIPCQTICRPGPKAVDLVERLAQILYPDKNPSRWIG